MSNGYLIEVIILLVTAVFVVPISRRIKISPIVGYFLAGIMVGPGALGFLQPSHVIDNLGEFGVVCLLFLIGLELTFDRLAAMRRHVFGFGSLQVIITTATISSLCYASGIDPKASAIIGGGLALSSTAIVLQVLDDSGYRSSQVGRLSLAVLLLQDFAVVPLMVLVPIFAKNSSPGGIWVEIIKALGNASVALICIFVVGRLLLRPLFSLIASIKSNEIFIATTLLIVIGASYITDYFGLSMALGAFVAGLLVAETEYIHEVEEAIMPFKSLFLGLFFMTVGMSLNLQLLASNWLLIVALVCGLVLLKAGIIFGLCRLFGFKASSSLHAGLLLAQGGEFGFVLFGLANEQNVVASHLVQIFIALNAVSMTITPFLASLGMWIANSLEKQHQITKPQTEQLALDTLDMDQHTIIIGFGRVGQMVARMLSEEQINYVAIDIDQGVVRRAREEGFPIYLGDISSLQVLKSLGMERASAAIISIKNEITTKKILRVVRENFPDLSIIVRVSDFRDEKIYRALGAEQLVPETYETGLQLGAAALSALGYNNHSISLLKNRFRKGNYALAQAD